MGLLKKILKKAVVPMLVSLPLFFGSCTKETPTGPVKENDIERPLGSFSETTIGTGYERPSGMSSYNPQTNLSKSVGFILTNSGKIIFTERPTFTDARTFGKSPKLNEVDTSGTIIKGLYDFIGENPDDFNEGLWAYQDSSGNRFHRSKALNLETALSGDNALISSSAANKIFRINTNTGERDIFKQDDELAIARDIMIGSDGKVYAAQPPLYTYVDDTTHNVSRQKRIISIDSLGNIKTEFELTNRERARHLLVVPKSNTLYGGLVYQMGHQLKLVENSSEGKKINGIDLFVVDFLDRRIFGASKDSATGAYTANIFKEFSSNLPLTGAVSDNGDLYVVTTPLLDSAKNIVQYSKVLRITSEGAESEVYTLSDKDLDKVFKEEAISEDYVNLDGTNSFFSRLYDLSAAIYEDFSSVNLFIADSYPGKIRKLTARK